MLMRKIHFAAVDAMRQDTNVRLLGFNYVLVFDCYRKVYH